MSEQRAPKLVELLTRAQKKLDRKQRLTDAEVESIAQRAGIEVMLCVLRGESDLAAVIDRGVRLLIASTKSKRGRPAPPSSTPGAGTRIATP